MKECKCCKATKESGEFHKSKKSKDGLTTLCRECRSFINAARLKEQCEMYQCKFNLPLKAVYAFTIENEIVYVGNSENLPLRVYGHFTNSSKGTMKSKGVDLDLLDVVILWEGDCARTRWVKETYFINKLKPIYNERVRSINKKYTPKMRVNGKIVKV